MDYNHGFDVGRELGFESFHMETEQPDINFGDYDFQLDEPMRFEDELIESEKHSFVNMIHKQFPTEKDLVNFFKYIKLLSPSMFKALDFEINSNQWLLFYNPCDEAICFKKRSSEICFPIYQIRLKQVSTHNDDSQSKEDTMINSLLPTLDDEETIAQDHDFTHEQDSFQQDQDVSTDDLMHSFELNQISPNRYSHLEDQDIFHYTSPSMTPHIQD